MADLLIVVVLAFGWATPMVPGVAVLLVLPAVMAASLRQRGFILHTVACVATVIAVIVAVPLPGTHQALLIGSVGGALIGAALIARQLVRGARISLATWRAAAFTDQLTGVLNRRGLEQEVPAFLPSPASAGMLLADVDQLKTVNDTLGHAAGDQLLRAAAQTLLDAVGQDGLVARVGGDEFMVVVFDVTAEELTTLRTAVMTTGPGLTVGQAWAPDCRSVEASLALFPVADADLYRAKAERELPIPVPPVDTPPPAVVSPRGPERVIYLALACWFAVIGTLQAIVALVGDSADPVTSVAAIGVALTLEAVVVVFLLRRRPSARSTTPAIVMVAVILSLLIVNGDPHAIGGALWVLPVLPAARTWSVRSLVWLLVWCAVIRLTSAVFQTQTGWIGVLIATAQVTVIAASAFWIRRLWKRDERLRRRLTDLVGLDPLTGLANRHGIKGMAIPADPVEILVIDVDDFKGINDRFGHLTGDQVLIGVGAVLRTAAPEALLVARIGGDEFAVIGPADSAGRTFDTSLLPVPVSLSVGRAVGLVDQTADLWRLMDHADQQLLRRRHSVGRADTD